MQNYSYQKGEIISVDLGNPPNEARGHEQAYDRPCLVIKYLPQFKLLIVVPCTSKEPRYNHFTVVKLLKGNGGLTIDSYILCHQIRTISTERVLSKKGQIQQKDFIKVTSVIADTLEL